MIAREAAYAALFARVSAVAGFVTTSRLLRHWTDVARQDQPALFQAQGRQVALTTPDNLPARWALRAELYVYVRNDDPAEVLPSTTLNNLVDAIEAALTPPPGAERQTLGGVVEHCRIAGEIETDDGVLGTQALAIIPIELFPTPS